MCVCVCRARVLQCRQCLISYWGILHVYLDRPDEAAALMFKAASLGVDVGTLVPDPEEIEAELAAEEAEEEGQ